MSNRRQMLLAALEAAPRPPTFFVDSTSHGFVTSFSSLCEELNLDERAGLGILAIFEGLLSFRALSYPTVPDAPIPVRAAELRGRTFLPPLRVLFLLDAQARVVHLVHIGLCDGVAVCDGPPAPAD